FVDMDLADHPVLTAGRQDLARHVGWRLRRGGPRGVEDEVIALERAGECPVVAEGQMAGEIDPDRAILNDPDGRLLSANQGHGGGAFRQRRIWPDGNGRTRPGNRLRRRWARGNGCRADVSREMVPDAISGRARELAD